MCLMLTEDANKIVNFRSWRWMPGMSTLAGDRIKSSDDDGNHLLDRGYVSLDSANNWCVVYPPLAVEDRPNLEDSATVGCILEVLHRVSGMSISLGVESDVWYVSFSGDLFHKSVYAASRNDVLLTAFEAVDFGLKEFCRD